MNEGAAAVAPRVTKHEKTKTSFMILTAVLILFGAICFLYPAVSNIVNEQFNESRIDEYTDNVDAISQNEINRYFSVAEKYNIALAEDVSDGNSDVSVLSDYENILNLDDGVMGYVEIPSIAVRLPIYHGESEDILEKGAAHLEHTSFPIGGENTHQKFMSDNLGCESVKAEVETYLYGEGDVFKANEYEVAAFTGRGEKFLHHPDVHLQSMSSFTVYPPVVSLQNVMDRLS